MSIDPTSIKPGDLVTRSLGEVACHPLLVTSVAETSIHATDGWCRYEFHRFTGGEIDRHLGWDGVHLTGGRLSEIMPCPAGEPFTLRDLKCE
jgi:hypothetical protein